ncbi:hypothetical protein B0T24DRAFT_673862 [Lasiosphaeria ovina]|uniref:Uncharacterized protein n=1 Tax=Lasiosphaeria ovina TaxID=92902 RepID=A0AAE0NM39_9PEZI|nr:hypothetical protein B0T24DRAFT_673862 [Lasiosphaeria ovina]
MAEPVTNMTSTTFIIITIEMLSVILVLYIHEPHTTLPVTTDVYENDIQAIFNYCTQETIITVMAYGGIHQAEVLGL